MPPLHIVILAAGQGKRMRSARAKVLLPVAGVPMLDHVIATARALAPQAIHVVHGHCGEQLLARYAQASDLQWVQQAEQRGTGHAVAMALDHSPCPIPDHARVLVLLGDVPLVRVSTLQALLASTDRPLALLAMRLTDPTGYGRVVLDARSNGTVQAIVEQRDADAATRAIDRVNTGLIQAEAGALRRWLAQIRPDNAQGELYLTDVFALAAAEGTPASCVDLADPREAAGANDPRQLAALSRTLEQWRVDALLEAGVRMARPDLVHVRGTVQAGADVELDVGVILEGTVVLGAGVRIGPYTRLRDCVLAAGTEVLAHSDLDGVVSEGAARIGPYARLRPGTRLAAGTHIGNFVETKQARFGPGSKANHLSYVGDAEVGRGVNIGAGTITCNYDGVAKHITRIEDGAFIGSNSALVAPVTIGAMATIGAGSVISRDAPADQLTLTRAPQRSLPGWQRPQRKPDAS